MDITPAQPDSDTLRFEAIRALHIPGQPFDSGEHFKAVAALPVADQMRYITWSGALPLSQQPLAKPTVAPPMTRDDYIFRLGNIEPLSAESVAAFSTQTQHYTNGPPPLPLQIGHWEDKMYGLKSQISGRELRDDKSIDPRSDFTLRQELICFRSGGANSVRVGPQIGVYLGDLVVRPKSKSGKEEVPQDVEWQSTKYSFILSALDTSIWLVFSSQKGRVTTPKRIEESEKSSTSAVGQGDLLKLFDSMDEMVELLERDGNKKLSKLGELKNMVPEEVTWWVVRKEDLEGVYTRKQKVKENNTRDTQAGWKSWLPW